MKNTRIGLLILSIFAFEHLDAKQTDDQKSVTPKITRPTLKNHMPQKTNENNHDITVQEGPLHRHEHIAPSIDKKVKQEPDGTIVETVTNTQIQDNKVITTTKTWSWKDYAKIAAGVGLAALAGAAYNSYYNPTPEMPENNINPATILTPQALSASKPTVQPDAMPDTTIRQQTKKSFLEKGLERYLNTVAVNPDFDNPITGDNYIAPDEFDTMVIHPVTEVMELPFDIKDRLTIAAQNTQDPNFKFGTSIDTSLNKIHELNAQQGDAYIKADEGDQSLGHTVSNLGIARMYAPAYRGIRPAPAPANTSKAVTTVTPAQQQAMTNVMKTNPNQFTTAIRTQAGSNIPVNPKQQSILSHAGTLPIETPQKLSATQTQTGSNVTPRSDSALVKTIEITGHTTLEAHKFNPHLNPSLQVQPWTPGGNTYSA